MIVILGIYGPNNNYTSWKGSYYIKKKNSTDLQQDGLWKSRLVLDLDQIRCSPTTQQSFKYPLSYRYISQYTVSRPWQQTYWINYIGYLFWPTFTYISTQPISHPIDETTDRPMSWLKNCNLDCSLPNPFLWRTVVSLGYIIH